MRRLFVFLFAIFILFFFMSCVSMNFEETRTPVTWEWCGNSYYNYPVNVKGGSIYWNGYKNAENWVLKNYSSYGAYAGSEIEYDPCDESIVKHYGVIYSFTYPNEAFEGRETLNVWCKVWKSPEYYFDEGEYIVYKFTFVQSKK